MKRRLSIFLIITMLFSSFNVFAENENGLSDISGHWAEEIIRMEYERGLVSGYPDNTFKPDKMMTNAELITFINHCFGLKESSDENYHDVAAEKWYASEAAKAKYYGYIESLNANPEQMAKREDVVNIMSSLMDFEEENVSDPGADFSDIDDESLEKKVERMSRLGYINGFEDGTFRPEESLTRAEILSISYRALGYIVKSQDDLKKLPKNVSKITIINPDIKIENMDLKSDLYIAPGAGGNIKLKNVNVNGNIIISGGSGDKGIEIENISAKNIAVTKSKTPLKVRIFGKNKIAKITTKTPVSISLSGSTEINEILSRSDTKIDIGKGITIKKLIIDSKTELSGGDDSSIDEVQANAEAEITGKIKVKNAIIKSENVKIENRPSYVKIDENVEKVEIDDSKMDSKNDDYADSKKSSGGGKKDRIPPSGYDLKFEQESINIENRSNVAIAFTSAENASKYSYKIEDSIGKYVEGSGVIAGTEHKVENIDLRTLSDGEIKLTGRLTDVSGNTGTIVSDKISKDTKRPDGYGLRIDYQPINKSTEKYFSFSIEDGEAGADYIYEIEDIGNDSVNGSGRMKSEFQNIDDIDVSGLSDGRLNLSLYLMDGVGNRGNTVSEDVYKDTSVEGDAIVRFDQEVINKKNVKDVSFSVVGAEHESNFNYEIYNEDDKKTKISGSEKALSKIETVDGLDLSKIDDGTVCFSVYLKDSAGNRGIDMTSRLRKDTLEPDGYGVEILQERIDSSNEKHMSFKISNGEIGCKYEFKFDDEDSSTRSVEGSGTIDTRNQSVDEVDISGLSDGNISLVLVLKDGAGNSGDKVDDSVIKDATAASGYSVEIEQKIINDSNKSSMSFVLSGAESGSTYYYKLNDSDSKTAAVLGEGTAAGESNRVENIDASGLSDGTITLEVYLVDESENKGSSVKDTVDKDTVVPEGYMVKIDPDKVNDSNHNDISFTFSGAEVGANYNYSISDGTKEVKLSGTISDSDESIDDIDVSRLSDGTLTLRVILIDVAGNEGQETTDTVIKDATAPSGYTVDIDQDRIDDSNQSVMSFVFGGAEVGSNYSYRVSDGTGEVSDTGTISTSTEKVSGIDVSGLSDGTLTLKVKLDDGFGNKGLEVVDTIVKDTDSPSGYSVSIDQDSINNSNKAAMSFTFSSAEVGATYSYTVRDGTSQVSDTGIISTATDQISNIDVGSLSDGTLTLSVKLTDEAGNEGSPATDTIEKSTEVEAPNSYTVSYPGENYPEEGIYTKTDEVINSKMVYKFVNGANEVFKIYWSDTKNRWELHDINHTVKMGHSKSPNQGDIPPTEGWIAADESDSYWGDYTVTSN